MYNYYYISHVSDTIREAYQVLIEKIPTMSTPNWLSLLLVKSTASDILLCQEDYPDVKSWIKQAWDKYCAVLDHKSDARIHQHSTKSKSKPSKPSKTLGFVESAARLSINHMEACDLTAHARVIWTQLESLGLAPDTWTKATVDTTTYFHQKMYQYQPDLQLCEAHWKNHHWQLSIMMSRMAQEECQGRRSQEHGSSTKLHKKNPKAQGTLDSPFKKWKVEEWDDDHDNPTILIIELALVNPNTLLHAIITSLTSMQLLPITSDQPPIVGSTTTWQSSLHFSAP